MATAKPTGCAATLNLGDSRSASTYPGACRGFHGSWGEAPTIPDRFLRWATSRILHDPPVRIPRTGLVGPTSTVPLRRLSSAIHDNPLAHLCIELMATERVFAGSGLRLVFEPVGSTRLPNDQVL